MLKKRALSLSVVVLTALTLTVGCGGVDFHKLNDAQEAVDKLKAKGIPDEIVSDARVHLYQAKEHLNKGNKGPANKAYTALKEALEKAEKYYTEQVANLGPTIDAARAAALKAKEELTGYQARKIDSTIAVVDSFRKLDWLLQSNNVAQELVGRLPAFREDEQKTSSLRKQVPGTWVFEDKFQSVEVSPKDAAVTRKIFAFGRDGKVKLTESKKGQSGPFFKEDWLFRSWGTYDYKGDTIMLTINRFKIEKQMFEKYHLADKKWLKEPGPTYDSAITDGSQDRYITYDDLKLDFNKR